MPEAGTLESAKSYWEKKATPAGENRPDMENKKLRQISADYTRVKRVFGPEQVAAAVEADKQREQAERGRKRPRHSLDRGGR